ncbi:hypothetical protein FHS81_003720 [Pseudochelatococcus contaminans]|uniref:Uncharacterized protein n=1 Tax=Pseudochelatococcus contaminans TaxID=1538103 RepID=A0A7W5Z849_9HYPH|nr:hypothetical protein [Pseudochelatococcus contaminans]
MAAMPMAMMSSGNWLTARWRSTSGAILLESLHFLSNAKTPRRM